MVTLVFFSTSTCAYCKPIKTIIDNLKEDFSGQVEFAEVIVDKTPQGMSTAREWLVNAVPTILIIANREEKGRLVGDIDRDKIVYCINSFLDKNEQGDIQSDVLPKES
jgi:thiol-disulfide isomerase/thioredoxin